jgi:hypothetical protein
MTTGFFVAPYRPTDWQTAASSLRIDPERYRSLLKEKWGDNIRFLQEEHSALAWDLRFYSEDGTTQGSFGRLFGDLQIVALETPYEEFFLWHRSVIEGDHRLFLFNASSPESLELGSDTTMDEIRRFCG